MNFLVFFAIIATATGLLLAIYRIPGTIRATFGGLFLLAPLTESLLSGVAVLLRLV